MNRNDYGYPLFPPITSYYEGPLLTRFGKVSALLALLVLLASLVLIFCSKAHAQIAPYSDEQIGTASYYTYQSCIREGTSGVWTASGEQFDENDMTAAMWNVKFGTKFKITNVANGLTVIVRINDRGPSKRLFKKGRIIDLSKGAFEKIADLKKGIIRVKVEIVNNGK